MPPSKGSLISRNGTVLAPANNYGFEPRPADIEEVEPGGFNPETLFDARTNDAITTLAVGKGVAEAYFTSVEDDLTILALCTNTSDPRIEELYSPKHWTVEYTAELGADVTEVKYPSCRETMEWVVKNTCPTEVIMSSESKTCDQIFVESVESVKDASGTDLAVGQNVQQRDAPRQILDAPECVIHEGRSTEDVFKVAA